MKIDRSKLKKGNFDVPLECKSLINKISSCKNDEELLKELKAIKTWVYGRCELLNWVTVLDKLDAVLESNCRLINSNGEESQTTYDATSNTTIPTSWHLACDSPSEANRTNKELLLATLHFSSLLIEHSFTRHLYSSTEHLTLLLLSCDMSIVLAVIDVLYVFSKRSNFITRLSADKKQTLITCLIYLAESWGGKENGFGLAQCCQDLPMQSYPESATTLHFEYYDENPNTSSKKSAGQQLRHIQMDHLDKQTIGGAADVMTHLLKKHNIPKEKQIYLFTHIRLAISFSNHKHRLECVQARLQALSTLIYCNAAQEHLMSLIYPGFIGEIVDLLQLEDASLTDIKATALRTLTAIVHLEGNRKLSNIIETTGTSLYHGFLPQLIRKCIYHMTEEKLTSFPQLLTTSLFSFLYHLASYESGGEALISCGMMESLLKVVEWKGNNSQDHITFVTRAVRVIDLITNLDAQSFQAYGAMQIFINRLQHEIDYCKKEQPFVFEPRNNNNNIEIDHHDTRPPNNNTTPPPSTSSIDDPTLASQQDMEVDDVISKNKPVVPAVAAGSKGTKQCYPQRAALLKSMLNFLKKAINDASFVDAIRHLMDGSLTVSLKHMISNAEYYGPALFLLATELVTVYVFQEPSMLSSLQSNGLTDVMLQALLIKDVPAIKEVLAALPNVFSALCLNSQGLEAFVACKPFDHLFKVLLSPHYLPAMRRKRGSDVLGDTATSLGSAVDELMRHQPSLRATAVCSIIKLLEELNRLGNSDSIVCLSKSIFSSSSSSSSSSALPSSSLPSTSANNTTTNTTNNSGTSSEDEEDEDVSGMPPATANTSSTSLSTHCSPPVESSNPPTKDAPTVVPLIDYILHVMKFIEAILSNNTTDDHCREFVSKGGLQPLLTTLTLSNLPQDFPTSYACVATSNVCKSILTLTQDASIVAQCLDLLDTHLDKILPIDHLLSSSSSSPSLQSRVIPVHSLVVLLSYFSRMSQADIRLMVLSQWVTPKGQRVMHKMSQVNSCLYWQCPRLVSVLRKEGALNKEVEVSLGASIEVDEEVAMETDALKSDDRVEEKTKWLLMMSKLSRSMTELLTQLARLCVGSALRLRRGQQINPIFSMPSKAASALSLNLSNLLHQSINQLPSTPSTSDTITLADWKLRMTYYVCCIKITTSTLFDEKKQPYHLMLQHFVSTNNHATLFSCLEWVLNEGTKLGLTSDSKVIPAQCDEFMETMLSLLERLTDPVSIMESPHNLPNKTTTPSSSSSSSSASFDPSAYLKTMHKMSFRTVKLLWGMQTTCKVRQHIIAILHHIINLLYKEDTSTETSKKTQPAPQNTTAPTTTSFTTPVHPTQQALLDMGFGEMLVREAMSITTTLEEATEYCLLSQGYNNQDLSTTPASTISTSISQQTTTTNVTVEPMPATTTGNNNLVEAERVIENIIRSNMNRIWGMDVDTTTSNNNTSNITDTTTTTAIVNTNNISDTTTTPSTSTLTVVAPTQVASALEAFSSVAEKAPVMQQDDEKITVDELKEFVADIINDVLDILDRHPKLVHHLSDLLLVIFSKQHRDDTTKSVSLIIDQIKDHSSRISQVATPMVVGDGRSTSEWVNEVSSQGSMLAVRLHLLTLLYQNLKHNMLDVMEKSGCVDVLVSLLYVCVQCLSTCDQATVPSWTCPLLLLLELHEKVWHISVRKDKLQHMLGTSYSWRWFDERSGKWTNYASNNNNTITQAYLDNKTSVKFSAGRRRYIITFSTMTQVNEETGSKRPIMLSIPPCQPSTETEEKHTRALTADQAESLLRSCVDLIGCKMTGNTLHACLRLVLRLTRDFKYSQLFVSLGGVNLLMALDDSSNFPGLLGLISLIVRHCLEDDLMLRKVVEKMIRSCIAGVHKMASKEFNYLMRYLTPAICRHPSIFKTVASQIVRFNVPSIKDDEEESRFLNASTPLFLKCLPIDNKSNKNNTTTTSDTSNNTNNTSNEGLSTWQLNGTASTVVKMILDTLIHKQTSTQPSKDTNKPTETIGNNDTQTDTSKQTDASKQADPPKQTDVKKNVLLRSSVLRLLSELVKSYSVCGQLVMQHQYKAHQSELLTEDCSMVTFMLDNMVHHSLPLCQHDDNLPISTKTLIASIACHCHLPDVQNALVTEVKGALHRCLTLPESSSKHVRIQAITSILATIIEADAPLDLDHVTPDALRQGKSAGNSALLKLLLKKGLATDLARVVHHLDLSNPALSTTINTTFKPLELLIRFLNQPSNKQPTPQQAADTALLPADAATNEAPATNTTANEEGSLVQESEDASQMYNDNVHNSLLDQLLLQTPSDVVTISTERADDHEDTTATVEIELTTTSEPPNNRNIQQMSDNEEEEDDDDDEDEDGGDDDDDDEDDEENDGAEEDEEDEDAGRNEGRESGNVWHELEDVVIEERDDADDDDDDEDDDEDDDDIEDDEERSIVEEDDEEDEDGFFEVEYDESQVADGLASQWIDLNTSNDMFGDSGQMRSIHMPVTLSAFDTEGHHGASTSSNNITTTHPMLQGPQETTNNTTNAPTLATSTNRLRSRGARRTLRYNNNTHSIQLQYSRAEPSNVLLQRLLGATSDVIQVTNSTGTRLHVLAADDVRMVTRPGDESFLDNLLQPENVLDDVASQWGGLQLSSLPTIGSRWSDESKILEGEINMHETVALVKSELLSSLEKWKMDEVKVQRDKRQKEKTETPKTTNTTTTTFSTPTTTKATEEQLPTLQSVLTELNELATFVDGNLTTTTTTPSVNNTTTNTTTAPAFVSNSISVINNTSTPISAIATPPNDTTTTTATSNNISSSSFSTTTTTTFSTTTTTSLSTFESTATAALPTFETTTITSPPTFESTTPYEATVATRVTAAMEESSSESTNASALTDYLYHTNIASSPSEPPWDMDVTPQVADEDEDDDDDVLTPTITTAPIIPPSSVPPAVSLQATLTTAVTTSVAATTVAASTTATDTTTSTTTSAATATVPSTSSEAPAADDSLQLEGVDPSFLAALPENIRLEVITEQLYLQRARSHANQVQQQQESNPGVNQVSPEFLAALPSNIQLEVLAEQNRLSTQNPDAPVDAGSFIRSLPPTLRQQVLSDMDDSVVALLPEEMASEASSLRRQMEDRQRMYVQGRLFHHSGMLSGMLRHQSRTSRALPMRTSNWSWTSGGSNNKTKGRYLLDSESLACLLVLLFIDEPRISSPRLHNVIKQLCHHAPTRTWVVNSLLSILSRTNKNNKEADDNDDGDSANWLNVYIFTALGSQTNVFKFSKSSKSRHKCTINIHPQASSLVCKHILDLLISLARTFPTHFLPSQLNPDMPKDCQQLSKVDFWDALLRLDSCSGKRKKERLFSNNETSPPPPAMSGHAHLLSMLAHPVITKNQTLVDKLLRLLKLISSSYDSQQKNKEASKSDKPLETPLVEEQHLKLVIDVLTSKTCSEEGLSDVTSLLLQLSKWGHDCLTSVLKLLVTAVHLLGSSAQAQITDLLKELKEMDVEADENAPCTSQKGVLQDRYGGNQIVVHMMEGTRVRSKGKELQLLSMQQLTSSNSQQHLLLRLLKVVVTQREWMLKNFKATQEAPEESGPVAMDTAEADQVTQVPTSLTTQQQQSTQQSSTQPQPSTEQQQSLTEQPSTQQQQSSTQQQQPSTQEQPPPTTQQLPPSTTQQQPSTSTNNNKTKLPALTELIELEGLWKVLSECLTLLSQMSDSHAVLVLQPAVEAFFIVHSGEDVKREDNPSMSPSPHVDRTTTDSKFVIFAEKHRTILNQILRQSTAPLVDGPFSVLVDHTKVLDFDVKRKYFRHELERGDEGHRKEDLAIHVRRNHVFEDSFRELHRRAPDEWKNRFYIVFEGEEGQDAGGLLREWYIIISREIFNPMYALFRTSPGDRVTYTINPSSHCNSNHLSYFKFVGRVMAKAIYDNKLLECYFTRSFYKHILGVPVKYTDMESEDYTFYKGLVYLIENNVEDLGYELTFSTEIQEFGVTTVRDLKEGGRNIKVTEDVKKEYVKLLCQMKMTGAIKQQLKAFLDGFHSIIPKKLISIFNEQELELIISGLPSIDIDDLKANTEIHKYQNNALQIQWLWRALRSFDQADRARFLQFVTGTSKVPLQGFAYLEGMNGTQKFQIHKDDRSTDRLPSAHTCFNQLDLPLYETYDKLKHMLLMAINECSEGFGLA